MKSVHSIAMTPPKEQADLPPLLGLGAKGGVSVFWVVNDECDRERLSRDLEAIAGSGIEAVILHPRGGLLLPYGGRDWFDLAQWAVVECRRLGLELIIYDEDPYPSGNAGGRITAENPEWIGYEIQPFYASDDLEENEPFVFPIGRLCWAGIVFPDAPERPVIDLTDRVGTLRRHWEKAEWDSKWYYPDTPLYPCPRAMSHHAEYGVRLPSMPEGGRAVAFVARPCAAPNEWGTLVDTLNPDATQRFLALTHERYARCLGATFGREIHAFFTDEAKPHARYSWTPGIFEGFQRQFGYDLRPKLYALFCDAGVGGMQVRTDYRLWIAERFERAWLQPVSRWCAEHGLALIGHLSPEEDPISQSSSLGNLLPMQKHFSLSGFDLIIPAIGDSRHPILNVAAIQALSTAQQNGKPGICCEALGAFGLDASTWHLGRVMGWLVLHGVNLAVIHGAFSSLQGLRRFEAPPDYGPNSPAWPAVQAACRELKPFYEAMTGAIHHAPTAILWPILSFHAKGADWIGGVEVYRSRLLALLQLHLSEQVGVHLLDEAELLAGEVRDGELCLGNARYSRVIVPSCLVLAQSSFDRLGQLMEEGVQVIGIGEGPEFVRQPDGVFQPVASLEPFGWPVLSHEEFVASSLCEVARAMELPEALRPHLQVSRWERDGQGFVMLFHVGEASLILPLSGGSTAVEPGDLLWLRAEGRGWVVHRHFSPNALPPTLPTPPVPTFGMWTMVLPPHEAVISEHPLALWQIAPLPGKEMISMILTPTAVTDGERAMRDLIYEVDVALPGNWERVVLLVEPTLMRGRFTLEVNGRHSSFEVRDTGVALQRIDLSAAFGRSTQARLRFTLHKPASTDGIKSNPRFELA